MLVTVINLLVVMVTVIIHYEFLHWLTRLLPRLPFVHRARIVCGVGGALVAHSIEVWVFGVAFHTMISTPGWGTLHGEHFNGTLLDCVYFSFTVFTTLGFGDIYPEGDLRYLIGVESLTGLVLIPGPRHSSTTRCSATGVAAETRRQSLLPPRCES